MGFLIIVASLIFVLFSCSKSEDYRTSTGTLLYQPYSDTCSNCESSYIVFDNGFSDTVLIAGKIPRKYRVEGGVQVKVVWELYDAIQPCFYLFPENHCGPFSTGAIAIHKYQDL